MRPRRPASGTDPVTDYDSFDEFVAADSLPSGRFEIQYEGAPVDFLYESNPDAKATVVIFHGSTKKDVDLPMLSGTSIMEGLSANLLAVSDPSLTLDDSQELILSWFMGSKRQPDLQQFLAAVVQNVVEKSQNKPLIFLGGSGGGFASLALSRYFPPSVALVKNPQINLGSYYPKLVSKYLDICWDGLESLSELPNDVTHNLVDEYPSSPQHTVAYLQNTRDRHHVENHQIPFVKKIGNSENVLMLMDAWGKPEGKGHVRPPGVFVRNILESLINSHGEWKRSLLDCGFTTQTNVATIQETVRRSNKNLAKQIEIDDM